MASGVKGFVKCDGMKHLYVPHYEALTLEKILVVADQHYPAVVERYFPIRRELLKFPRQVRHGFEFLRGLHGQVHQSPI